MTDLPKAYISLTLDLRTTMVECKAPRKVASRDMQEAAEINANGTSFCTLVLPFISNSRPDGMRERGQVGSE